MLRHAFRTLPAAALRAPPPPPLLYRYRNMATLSVVNTKEAPAAVGPYVQAIKLGDLVFCSGCLGLNPESMTIVEGGVVAETEQAMKNMKTVVEAAGSDLSKVVKTTVFLKSMDDFAVANGIYERVFAGHKPARSCVEVARLPKDALFEIECIASLQ
ncbi:hypothetical protein MKEN_01277300 [Mycena kentingensis (nom. inval.)]|nr:hypothetical protein MKEN_01277300 [Mycena kentingensis (nom. inval.)]